MTKKVTRIAVALVLALGLVLSSASITLAKPQPIAEIVNLHLDGTALHFQLHLVSLSQAFSYNLSVARSGWGPVFEDDSYALGKVSKNYTSPEISRDLSILPGWRGPRDKWEVEVQLLNRKGVWLGFNITATYTFVFNVTFNETNDLSGVSIQLYTDAARTVPKGSALTTDEFGETSPIALEDATTYWYKATKTDYPDVLGLVIVGGSNKTVNFHMPCTYTVTFNETNGLSDVLIDIWRNNGGSWDWIDYVTTNTSGQVTIDLLEGAYYYQAQALDYAQSAGYFTVSGPAQTVNITMEPLYTVTFDVVDGNTLDPVSDVEIDIYVGGEYYDYVVTDGNGEATIELASGSYSYDVTSTPEGYHYYEGVVSFDVDDYDKTLDIELWTS